MRRPVLAGCLLLSLGSVASGQPSDDALSPMEILAGIISPAQPPGGTAKSDTKADAAKKPDPTKTSVNKVDHLAQCLRDWDAATHMTRQEWARTCRRVVSSRLQFLREQENK
jgi:hypothetical protein